MLIPDRKDGIPNALHFLLMSSFTPNLCLLFRYQPITYEILVLGTGHNADVLSKSYWFLGTVKLHNGALMFHVFYQEA